MGRTAVLDNENRVELPEEAKGWFEPGTQFEIEKAGNTVTLRRIAAFTDYFDAVRAAGNEDEMSLEEIQEEVRAVRAERSNRSI